jgi:hypothetical protein
MLPEMPGKLVSGEPYGVEIRRGCIVAKSPSSIEDTMTTLQTRVKGDQVRVALQKVEGTADVVISDVQFLIRVVNTEIVKPNHKLHFRSGKGQRGLLGLLSPIIDGEAPRVGVKATVDDRVRALEDGPEVNDALGSQVTMQHEEDRSRVQQQGETLPIAFNQHGEGLIGLFSKSGMVPTMVVGGEIFLSRGGITIARDTMKEDASEVVNDTIKWRNAAVAMRTRSVLMTVSDFHPAG